MADLTLRNVKGSPLTNQEVDDNFSNLNDDKVEKSGDTLTGDLAFGDNVKAKFGVGNDLQIYHDSATNRSFIVETNTSGNLLIDATNIELRSNDAGGHYAKFLSQGAVELYHNNSKKFDTTSSGVDVTGTLVADGLTVDGEIILDSATGNHFLKFYRSDSTINAGNALGQILFGGSDDGDFPDAASIQASAATNWTATSSATQLDFFTTRNTTVTPVKRLTVDDSGDISFYDDSGTSQDFYWDASTSRLGLGTTSPSKLLEVDGDGKFVTTSGVGLQLHNDSSNQSYIQFTNTATGETTSSGFQVGIDGAEEGRIWHYGGEPIKFATSNTERMRIDSSGNLLVGTTTPNSVAGSSGGTLTGFDVASTGEVLVGTDDTKCAVFNRQSSDGEILRFRKDGSNVGFIGVDNSDNIFISGNSGHSGLMAGTDAILPYANGSLSSATEDLGGASYRWRNLYLSGGVYLGGTGSANLLDDYEEGTWFPVVNHVSGFSSASLSNQLCKYTKIGRQVTLEFEFKLGASTGNVVAGDDIVLTSNCLPFTPADGGHAVGTLGMQLSMATGENIAMAYAGLSATNELGLIFHTVDGTVARASVMGGVITYFTNA